MGAYQNVSCKALNVKIVFFFRNVGASGREMKQYRQSGDFGNQEAPTRGEVIVRMPCDSERGPGRRIFTKS